MMRAREKLDLDVAQNKSSFFGKAIDTDVAKLSLAQNKVESLKESIERLRAASAPSSSSGDLTYSYESIENALSEYRKNNKPIDNITLPEFLSQDMADEYLYGLQDRRADLFESARQVDSEDSFKNIIQQIAYLDDLIEQASHSLNLFGKEKKKIDYSSATPYRLQTQDEAIDDVSEREVQKLRMILEKLVLMLISLQKN